MSTSGQVTSKRSSIALQVRNSPTLENLNARRRMLLGSSADSTSAPFDVTTPVERDTLPSKDHDFTHPSFCVPQAQSWRGQARRRARSDLTGYAMTGSPSNLDRVLEEQPALSTSRNTPTKSRDGVTGHTDGHNVAQLVPPAISGTGNGASAADFTTAKRIQTRIMGPRPLPPSGTKTSVLGEDIETGTVKTGTPMEATSHVKVLPLHVEPESIATIDTVSATSATPQESLQPRPSSRQAYQNLPNLSTLSLVSSRDTSPEKSAGSSAFPGLSHSKAVSVRRKPVRSGTDDSNTPITPASGKQNIYTITRKPVSTASPVETNTGTLLQDADTVKPPLPPRRATGLPQSVTNAPNGGHLDLTLGQEKLGGGFDGEQAKLGKLIIEPEGQKMLDLIVATNLLAFRRAFAAADMMGRT